MQAQSIEEPEFVGEVNYIKPDQSVVLLEKANAQTRSAMNAGMVITGFGSYKNKLQLDGCCASTKIPAGTEIKFVVRAVDNNTDPLAIIKIFQFETNNKYRRAEMSRVNTFGTTKTNQLKYLGFTGKKFGNNSYLITLKDKTPGEYGITVSNPNALDEKSTIVSTFSIY